MPYGVGAGAAEGLEDVLARLFLAQKQRQMVEQQKAELAQQGSRDAVTAELGRGNLGVAQGGLAQRTREYDTDRSDAQAGAAAKAQKEAEQAAALEQFASGLPGHLQAPTIAKAKFGVQIAPQDMVRAPETYQEEDSRKLSDYEKREGVQLRGQLRLEGARQAGAKELEGIRQSGKAGGKADSPATTYSAERGVRIKESVDDLIGRVSNMTAGPGSLLAGVPATRSRDFAADLQKLKANIAFSELTEMREASKTGGALGQVSNIELAMLESALGALDPGQSPQNLVKNLQNIKDVSARWQAAKSRHGGGAAPTSAPATSGGEFDYVPGKGLVPRK
jgi:hypothetical protein